METKKESAFKKILQKGFPLSKFNWALELIILVVSVFLLLTTFKVSSSYQALKEASFNYMDWERKATQMELSSDHLTREVRLFVQELNPEKLQNLNLKSIKGHLDNYFTEVKESGTRETVLKAIEETFTKKSEIYLSLKSSLDESHALQYREYTAMRMAIESCGEKAASLLDLYDEVKTAELPSGYDDLTPEEKHKKANEYVNDKEYFDSKSVIESGVNKCVAQLIDFVQKQEDAATKELDRLLIEQRVWLGLFIAAAVTIILVTTYQIIRPLTKAVPYIRNDSAIPVTGAEEFRILVRTYNRMHKMNQSYREKLAYKASHDPLTGVLNRSGFEEVINDVDLSEVALLIVDIDFFKKVNDEYGHTTGDRALETVTQMLRDSFRTEDVICRMGGDEFAVIMWHTGPEKKELIDGKIAKLNNDLGRGSDDVPPLSLSVGVAFGVENDPKEIFRNADKALYRTKTSGRRGCSFYNPDIASDGSSS